MTLHECAIVEAYTGVCMLTGDRQRYVYEYVSELLGRPVYTHELGILAEKIKELAKPDFIKLCKEAIE
jgi:hypothetical protein